MLFSVDSQLLRHSMRRMNSPPPPPLMSSLSSSNTDANVPDVVDRDTALLAARHIGYGVRERNYIAVRRLLLTALQSVLPDIDIDLLQDYAKIGRAHV